MSGLKVLITNFRLDTSTGTELYVRDIALALLERGHKPIIYSPLPGKLAESLRDKVQVLDHLDRECPKPDVIHAQHLKESMVALLSFPGVPAVYFCHDTFSRADTPPNFPRVRRYVAVDLACRDKLLDLGAPAERISVVHSFVDLKRFKQRPQLPERPQRALVFCNYAKQGAHLSAILQACTQAGIQCDVRGEGVGNIAAHPEELLTQYDLVFAKGRAALEALAVGAAVIIQIKRRIGPLVTRSEVDDLLQLNFGLRALGEPLIPEDLLEAAAKQIGRYNAADARATSDRVRETAGLEIAANEIIDIYHEVIAEQKERTVDFDDEERAAAAYIQQLHAEWSRDLTWRTRDRLLKVPLLGKLARSVARIADRS
jgi:hypothetical protein